MAKKTAAQRWRDTWNVLSKPNKLTFVLSITAIFLTIASLIIDVIQNKQQNDLSMEMLLFQIEAESNSRDDTQKQIDIQNTQTALNAQLEAIARLQAFPLMVVVSSEKPVLVITQISDTNGKILLVSGNVDMILANNGGARAGLIEAEWLQNTKASPDLLDLIVEQVYVGGATTNLPVSVEAQTPVKIQIDLSANVKQPIISTDVSHFGNKDYQLKKYISDLLLLANSKVEFRFSNAEPITIPVSYISFDINGFHPEEPRPVPAAYLPDFWDNFYNISNVFVYLIGFLFLLMAFLIFGRSRKK